MSKNSNLTITVLFYSSTKHINISCKKITINTSGAVAVKL